MCRLFLRGFWGRFATAWVGRVRCAHRGMCGLAGARSPDETRDLVSSPLSSVLTVLVSPPGDHFFQSRLPSRGNNHPKRLPRHPALRCAKGSIPIARSTSVRFGWRAAEPRRQMIHKPRGRALVRPSERGGRFELGVRPVHGFGSINSSWS